VAITRADVERTATLARLDLTPDEIDRLTRDLSHILDAFERLAEVDTAGVEPTAHVEELPEALRADAVTNPPAGDELLGNAPARVGRHFRVPKIIE
jgi:aspartyl-tRNA(Asn)/glutamyl-tRNA(Gln) amidotransferase subunit C